MLNTDFYLFIYDIHDQKVLRRIVKRLDLINSMRIQKSVFEIEGNKKEVEDFIQYIVGIINIETDKVAIIPLCEVDYNKTELFGVLSRRPNKFPDFIVL